MVWTQIVLQWHSDIVLVDSGPAVAHVGVVVGLFVLFGTHVVFACRVGCPSIVLIGNILVNLEF